MKRVCHITSAHDRYDVRIFEKECSSLAKYDYEVFLIVNDTIQNEIKNKVHIVSTGFQPNNRFERMVSSAKLLYKKALEIDADIYHFHDPDLLRIGPKLKKKGKKVIFDAHEDVAKQIIDKTWIPGFLRKIISYVYPVYEKKVVRKLDAVVSVSPQFVERFKEINSNAVLITNYPILTNNEYRLPNDDKNICFAGGISKQWCHDKIIEAISNMEGVHYLLAGSADTSYFDYLKTVKGWDKVDYYGVLPHEEVKNIYARSKVGMAINYSNQIKGIGSLGNTKLYEFMEAGLPVICSDYKLWKEIIDKYHCGICVNPLDSNDIETAIRYMIDHPKEAESMGKNGRTAVEEHFSWNVEEAKLVTLYNDLRG